LYVFFGVDMELKGIKSMHNSLILNENISPLIEKRKYRIVVPPLRGGIKGGGNPSLGGGTKGGGSNT
jgi:hypothetical protein